MADQEAPATGYTPSFHNLIVWNHQTNRYEAWALHQTRGMMLFSYLRIPRGDIRGLKNWTEAVWGHMIEQSPHISHSHIKMGALCEFVQAMRTEQPVGNG